MYSRRDFGKIALAGLPFSAALALAKTKSVFQGVHLGVQTYSFRDFPPEGLFEAIIKAMIQIGLSECELFGPQALPASLNPFRGMMGRAPGQKMDDSARQKMAEARKKAEACSMAAC